MPVYHFLSFQDGAVEVCLAKLLAVLVSYGIEWNEIGVIILIPVFLLQRTVHISHSTIIICVVA